jgi:uncharacterized protein (DUF58 family)
MARLTHAPRHASPARQGLQARRALAAVAAGLALVLIAFMFNAAPLFVPGVALVGVGALAPAWVLASVRGARARRVLSAERVLENQPLRAEIEIHRSLAAWGWGRLEIVDPLTSSRLRLGGTGSPVRRARAARVVLTARFANRGEQLLAPPTIIARDPLELARAQAAGGGPRQTVLVLPRTERVRWVGSSRSRRLAGEGTDAAVAAMAATDMEGLRPYRPGTPASHIHWPAVARGHGLIERRLQGDGEERPLVVLDPRERMSRNLADPTQPAGDRAALDAAVRAAASLVLELAKTGGCGVLLPGQTRPTVVDGELSAWPAVHARLAVAGTDADPHRGAPPALRTWSQPTRRGPVVYVAAASHQRLAAALAGSSRRGVTVLVVPESEVVDGRPRGTRGHAVLTLSVSGCCGFALGGPRGEGRPRAAAETGTRESGAG